MSRLSKRAWYERVNAAWPAVVPALTGDEAVRAARRLFRFVRKRPFRGTIILTSGNRRSYSHLTERGREMYVNPDLGWHGLIHDLSHAWGGGHGRHHAMLERRMIREVVRRGWLTGKLKREPKPPPPPRDVRLERYKRVVARIASWQAKKQRAVNALRRLDRSRRYYERSGIAPG